ncbi:MAG: hypothetical protein FWD41_05690, partial [Actinomycetia bacterium]|nr:hypothetical protein [Actinomycetes bacterium]
MRTLLVGALVLLLTLVPLVSGALSVLSTTLLISAGPTGLGANNNSEYPAISADGRWVVFESWATDLIGAETNGNSRNIFLWDSENDETILVTKGESGDGANGNSYRPTVSADGSKVAFDSYALDLVGAPSSSQNSDVYVWDRATEQNTLISVGVGGRDADGSSYYAQISDDGTKVAYGSWAMNLNGAAPTNGYSSIFYSEVGSGHSTLVSVGYNGGDEGGTDNDCWDPAISGDGLKVAYQTSATNVLGAASPNEINNVYVWDADVPLNTKLISAGPAGEGGNAASFEPSLSYDGSKVAFTSRATDLVGAVANGEENIFITDIATDTTHLITVGGSGAGGNDWSGNPSLSADGSKVAYESRASDMLGAPVDTYDCQVFLCDVASLDNILVSAGPDDLGGNDDSYSYVCALSADGTKLTFESLAEDLVGAPT